jgi:quinoprotein glucose dehydrogenase
LGTLKNSAVTKIVEENLMRLEQNQFPKGAYLELFNLAESNGLSAKISAFRAQQKVAPTLTQYIECFTGGDVVKGEELFKAHPIAQCFRCHKVNNEGGDVGPDLSIIGKQHENHILESIVAPGAIVAPGYGMITVTKKDDSIVAGLFLKDNGKVLHIKVGDKIQKVKSSDVKSKTQPVSAMPPMALMVKKTEIRDIVAYLKTLRKKKKESH